MQALLNSSAKSNKKKKKKAGVEEPMEVETAAQQLNLFLPEDT